jgi:Dynamin family
VSVTSLLGSIRSIAFAAAQVVERPDLRAQCNDTVARCDEPLRIAFAGQTKAGKSTLLNALIGERVAATDHAECTRMITWYRHGPAYSVNAEMADGTRVTLPFARVNGQLRLDLDHRQPEFVERLTVTVPSRKLETSTLIDTPGIGSNTDFLHQRSINFLSADDTPSAADAVIYLMRHAHDTDVRFLEAIRDDSQMYPSPAHSIGVLSRADEIGACRLDAMASARRIAARYSHHERLTPLVQRVIPVCGLLAESAATLTQHEFDLLTSIAAWPVADFEHASTSVDDFIAGPHAVIGGGDERTDLLRRFGIYGTRLATMLLRSRQRYTATSLAVELAARSGLHDLTEQLETVFSSRGELLKAKSALRTMTEVCAQAPHTTAAIRRQLEQLRANAHELVELELLVALRTEPFHLTDGALDDARRLLGESGTLAWQRVGGSIGDSADDIMRLATEAHDRWTHRATNPLTRGATAALCSGVVRSCEALVHPSAGLEARPDHTSPSRTSTSRTENGQHHGLHTWS